MTLKPAPRTSSANVVGNVYDKYATRNPIARAMMAGFLDSITELYRSCEATTVLEVGCGEGRLAQHLVLHGGRPQRFEATDIDTSQVIDDLDPSITVRPASVYELPYETDSFDLVVCCEVLEHLEQPSRALSEVARVARAHVLISTPWEPVWRILNLLRGRYWRDLGNTPGHVQNFSRADLERLADAWLHIRQRRTPLPWTVLLGEPRG